MRRSASLGGIVAAEGRRKRVPWPSGTRVGSAKMELTVLGRPPPSTVRQNEVYKIERGEQNPSRPFHLKLNASTLHACGFEPAWFVVLKPAHETGELSVPF